MFWKFSLALILCLGLIGCALREGFEPRATAYCTAEIGDHCVEVCKIQVSDAVGFIAVYPFNWVKCVCKRPGGEPPVFAF